jgi:hypothetical protein
MPPDAFLLLIDEPHAILRRNYPAIEIGTGSRMEVRVVTSKLAKYIGLAAVALMCGVSFSGCEIGDSGNGGDGGRTLTNPVLPQGGGTWPRLDESARWQNYGGEGRFGRATAIKWPNSLYRQYGCTPQNTKCVVDGTEFAFYQIDEYPTGADMLSYGSTRVYTTFPNNFTAVLYKDGEPFAACTFPDPASDDDNVRLPATIELPGWAE